MRRLFAIVLVALLLGVGLVAIIETDPGYVLVSHGNYTLETSLWVGLLLLVLLVLLIYAVLRLVYRLLSGQRSLVSWLGTRKAHHAMRLSTRGVISFSEGNWLKARRQLLRGVQKNEAPLVNYLLAARSSQHLQEPQKVQEYLRAARDAEPEAAVTVDVTLAEMRLRAGEYEQALAALQEPGKKRAQYPHVLSLLCRAYEGLGDWNQLATLLPEIRKARVMSPEALAQLERQVHSSRLQQHAPNVPELHAAWQEVPAQLRKDADMLQVYVHLLIAAGDHATADKVILRALKHQWHAGLVRYYGLLEGDGASRRLSQAEDWLAKHPEDAQLLLALGRLSARERLWGKARDYFESSYRVAPGAEVCAELGRLLTGLDEPKVAAAYFREGLLQRENALPQLPVPDKVTAHS